MKIVTFKITVLFTMTLLLSGIVNSQNKDYKQKMTLNNVRTANLIITTQVVEKEQKIDTHNSKFETVRLIVKDIIEGNTKNDTIKISYYLNQIRDELFVIPKFEKGEDYVLVLYQDKNEGHTLLGGELGKFHLGTDKVNNVNFTKSELVSLLKRIRNNIQSDEDLITLNDLAGEMDGRLKLDGEFAIIHPNFHNKPKGQTITFRINLVGAKDINGNQLSFSQIYNVINNAISAWNSVSCSYTVFSFSSTQYSSYRAEGDGICTITFEPWSSNGGGDTPSLSSEINEYDIVFNSYLRWNTESTYPSSYPTYAAPSYAPYLTYPTIGPVDLQDVATHELGHPVGLADIWGYDFTMHPTDYTVNEWWERTSRRNLGMGDKAGKIYMDPDFVSAISQPTSKLLLSNNFITEFNGNFTVPSGYYLEIEPLKNLTFSSGASLIINGTFKAVGEPFPNSTSFDRKSTGYWGGIILNSSSTATIRNCYIAYANTGITCNNNSNAQIFDCIISDHTNNGIYLNNSSPTINNCTISNNTNKGIYAYNSSPTIKYSTLDNNNTGVYCDYYSSPTMVGNNIRYNTSVGIYCSTSSSPNLTDNGASGSNVIRNNGTNGGFYAQYNCVPDLSGYYSTGNSIFDNTGYELRAYYGCTIDATRIWWGSSDPAVVATYLYSHYSTINYLPILTSNPNPNRNIVPTESNYKIPIFTTANMKIDELELAKQYQRDGKYDEAINLFLEVFKKETNTSRGRYSLIKLEQCFTQANKKDFLSYSSMKLKPLVQEGNELFVLLLELETHQLYNMGYKDEAMNNLKAILSKYNLNEDIEKQTLYRIGVFYLDLYNDKVNAQKTFDELALKYPNDELLTYANLVLNEERYNVQGLKKANQKTAEVIKEELTNYPNPFNPTTVISFNLPQQEYVTLKVYDVLGKEVAVLVEGVQNSGRHEVKFDASELASGIYFYTLKAGKFTQTNKMMLLK